MNTVVTPDKVFLPSDNIVAREIEGELLIVPLAAGVADTADELFTLNETGRLIWDKLDGRRSPRQIAQELSGEYAALPAEILADVLGLLEELHRRHMVVEAIHPQS